MKLDANSYRVNVKAISDLTKDLTPNEKLESIGRLAVATGVPILIICTYLGEIYGFSDELNAKIKTLMLFYNVTEILNTKK